jgi:hypothetical protein
MAMGPDRAVMRSFAQVSHPYDIGTFRMGVAGSSHGGHGGYVGRLRTSPHVVCGKWKSQGHWDASSCAGTPSWIKATRRGAPRAGALRPQGLRTLPSNAPLVSPEGQQTPRERSSPQLLIDRAH